MALRQTDELTERLRTAIAELRGHPGTARSETPEDALA